MMDPGSVAEIRRRFLRVAVGHVCDALEHLGSRNFALPNTIVPMTAPSALAGPARTLRMALCRSGDEPRRLNDLKDAARPGDVIVIDACGLAVSAVFGDRSASGYRRQGAVGAVINGGVRDIARLNEMHFPVHGATRTPHASEGRLMGIGIDTVLVIGGVLVQPGDWVVADETAICIVPVGLVARVLTLAEEREAIDRETLEEIAAGGDLRAAHRHFKDEDPTRVRRLE